jgi:hypothetical protein
MNNNQRMNTKATEGLEDFNLSSLPEFDVDLNLDDFDLQDSDPEETRYTKPKLYRPIAQHNIKYDNAVKLARDLYLEPGGRANVVVAGNFIFGDFIEAYIRTHNIKVGTMTITTLSLNQENIDGLEVLMRGGYVDRLNLIISHYFYSHERQVLVPYIYKTLDIDDRFQLAVAGTHTKTVTFDTLGGKKMVIHGSANLRSSNNAELWEFYTDYQSKILDKYKTINHPIRVKPLWDLITRKTLK